MKQANLNTAVKEVAQNLFLEVWHIEAQENRITKRDSLQSQFIQVRVKKMKDEVMRLLS